MFKVNHALGTLPLCIVDKHLLVHLYNPLGWLDTILELSDILVISLRHSWEFKEVDCVDIHLCNKERVEHLLGSESQVRQHLFRIENHLVWVSKYRFILNVLATFIFSLSALHDFDNFMELFHCELSHL